MVRASVRSILILHCSCVLFVRHSHSCSTIASRYLNNFNGTDENGRSYKNPFAEQICFGFFVPCMCFQLIKVNWKPSTKIKEGRPYKLFVFLCNMLPLVCIIVGANVACRIKSNDQDTEDLQFYAENLKVVGEMKVGVDIIKVPKFLHPWGKFLGDGEINKSFEMFMSICNNFLSSSSIPLKSFLWR